MSSQVFASPYRCLLTSLIKINALVVHALVVNALVVNAIVVNALVVTKSKTFRIRLLRALEPPVSPQLVNLRDHGGTAARAL